MIFKKRGDSRALERDTKINCAAAAAAAALQVSYTDLQHATISLDFEMLLCHKFSVINAVPSKHFWSSHTYQKRWPSAEGERCNQPQSWLVALPKVLPKAPLEPGSEDLPD